MTCFAGRRYPRVMRASPVGQPPIVRHSCSSSGPVARWIAPSTPPPPSRLVFAALTIASICNATMFASRASSLPCITPPRRLPPTGREPLFDLVETIGAPERFAVDHDIGRAEHAARNRGVHFDLEPLLDCGIAERRKERLTTDAEPRGDVGRHCGTRYVEVFSEVAVIKRLGDFHCEPAILVVQPIVRPAGRLGRDRKPAGKLERDAYETRCARKI